MKNRTTKIGLASLLALVATVALAVTGVPGDKAITNMENNKDLYIQVTKSGVQTPVVKLTGSTGAASIVQNVDLTVGTGSLSGQGGLVLDSNTANQPIASWKRNGTSKIQVYADVSASDLFHIDSGTTQIMTATQAGVATIGPTTLMTTGQHLLNGRSKAIGGQANAEALQVKSNIATSGQSFGLVVDAGTTTADQNTLWRNQAGTTTFGQIDGTGNFGIGPGTPNASGWGATYEVMTIKGKSGTVGSGVLELANATGNTDTARIGVIDFVDAANTSGTELVTFNAITDGGTSANRGAYINLRTKPNGGGIVERMRWARDGTIWIGNGGSAIPAMYSTTTSGATTCDTACATEPATLDSGSGRCTSAWRSDTRAPLTGGAVAFGCADTTSVAKSCMCMGLSL